MAKGKKDKNTQQQQQRETRADEKRGLRLKTIVTGIGLLAGVVGAVFGGIQVWQNYSRQQSASHPDPRINLRVVSYDQKQGIAVLAIGVVNHGSDILHNFYVDWDIDTSLGEFSSNPPTTPQDILFEGRHFQNFNRFVTQALSEGQLLPLWTITVNRATRLGRYPMRVVFTLSDGKVISYPDHGIDEADMSLQLNANSVIAPQSTISR